MYNNYCTPVRYTKSIFLEEVNNYVLKAHAVNMCCDGFVFKGSYLNCIQYNSQYGYLTCKLSGSKYGKDLSHNILFYAIFCPRTKNC